MKTPDLQAGRVQSEIAGGVATISFSHPKSNSLPARLLADLAAAITAAGENENAQVIVLQSEGDGAFCGGASFAELQAITDPEAGKKFFMGFVHVILAMMRAPKFVVTRVHGRAVGGGVGLIAASDYAIAVRGASIKLSELAVGLGPFIVGLPIQKKMGLGPFSAMAIDADWRSAKWARRHGLYAELHKNEDDLDAALAARAEMLAASNPLAMAKLKRIFWEGTADWAERLESRATMSGSLALSEFTAKAVGRKSDKAEKADKTEKTEKTEKPEKP